VENKKTLSSQIEEALYQKIIIEQIYAPGEKLPNETILSEELGISRTTLREAVRSLVSQGILEIRRGKGTYITENAEIYNKDYNFKSMERLKISLKDLFEMRLIFEPEAVYYACKRATDEEIEKIIELGLYEEELIRKGDERTKADQKFHQAIGKATHNGFMIKFLPIIDEAIEVAIKTYPQKELLSEITLQDHALIMDFLKERDAECAKSAMTIHIRHAMQKLNIN
jgi:DNA-binding FadR family transcriptional regulator